MGEWGEEKGFSPSALSLFRFHLSPFPPETPDTQAITTPTSWLTHSFLSLCWEKLPAVNAQYNADHMTCE